MEEEIGGGEGIGGGSRESEEIDQAGVRRFEQEQRPTPVWDQGRTLSSTCALDFM